LFKTLFSEPDILGVSTALLVRLQPQMSHSPFQQTDVHSDELISQVMIEDDPFQNEDIYSNPGSHAPSENTGLNRISGRNSSSSLSAYFIVTTENLEEGRMFLKVILIIQNDC